MAEQENTGDGSQASLFKAAQYVRMSTEHQQYSTENQGDKIKEYAAHRGIEIIKTYTDAGKSGLRIDGRQALQQLIKDVETGAADFQIILVYDVSRWGRFQDADESPPTTSTFAAAPASRLPTAPSSSRTMAHRSRPSSKASNGQWLVNTAGSYRPRYSLASAAD
jgi:hypothetical protein